MGRSFPEWLGIEGLLWFDSGASSGIGGILSSGTTGINGILQPDFGALSRIGVISSPGLGVKSGSGIFFLGPFVLQFASSKVGPPQIVVLVTMP